MPPLPRLDPPKKYQRGNAYGPNPTSAALVKKQAIRQVAARLFAERGVAAVGLASVGMVAQLPNRGVSYYYRNREDLLGDILVDHVLRLTELVCAAYDATEAAARADAVVEAAQPPGGAKDSAATRARWTAGLERFERISAREALHRWYEVLPIAAAGVTFVITSREYPLAQLGPLTRAAADAAPAPQDRAAGPDMREAAAPRAVPEPAWSAWRPRRFKILSARPTSEFKK